MNHDATSLDRLHDLVLPPDVSWWPLAPGWYAVFAVLGLASAWWLWKAWKKWQANAYRRAALHELAQARDIAAIAEILRRTALAFAPRQVIAKQTGTLWIDWLAEQSPIPLPDIVRTQLTAGIYGRPAEPSDITSLHAFAAGWINRHHAPVMKL